MGLKISLLNVRRSILIQAPPGRVWQEFESFERIAAWLGHGHELHVFEPVLGGQVDMSVEMDGERRHYGVSAGPGWLGERFGALPRIRCTRFAVNTRTHGDPSECALR